MTDIRVFAPAKVNLALHVTGQREDGYHLLDSLVMFADFGDWLSVAPAEETSLAVQGPLAKGVPTDARNLCWRAADLFGAPVAITLEKHLPHAAGIGGGSSDAAAVLNGLDALYGPRAVDALALGADVPVCRLGSAARMAGIGEQVTALDLPELHAVLVNPGVDVPTPQVFKYLTSKKKTALPDIPQGCAPGDVVSWLARQRNDLEAPAIAAAPVISGVLDALTDLPDVRLARMSGSGATCFALFDTPDQALNAASILTKQQPTWWVQATVLS
jgi:4-diphosphocytidyl-2-C-methyl-D-erythritol kinase